MSILFHRGRVDPDKLNKLLISVLILALIGSFFLPFVLIAFVQDALYFSEHHWLFLAPTSAFYAIGGGLIWFAALILAYIVIYHIRDRKDRDVPHKWAFLTASLFMIPMITAGIANYYYIDESGIHFSGLTTISETTFHWYEIETVQPVGEDDRYIAYYLFTSKNGEYYLMPYTQDFSQQRNRIMSALEENDVPVLEQTYDPDLP
ncbi:hypothetical protein CR205_10305 [Alteribacter lacisalsi]|uniref:Uncharacterized protein n=1 Tax=Alteribacter lacisalsi TaxID=2045244 RepID=A0A2W0HDG4_9BACI|nr:hypothetical protein [Alteribacter lacisalsi]PYZ98936.1 hypothetical protein CR205_10305 [Alteribacter lacisalsi]